MLNAAQLAVIEAAMEEEHRQDREALQRLKRFLPQNGSGNGSPSLQERIDAARSKSKVALLPAGEHDDEIAINTITGTVEEILFRDPTKGWTVPMIVKEINENTGRPLVARKPEAGIGLIFAKLVKRGRARITRRGSGRIPHIYKAKVTPSVAEEGGITVASMTK